MDSLKISIQYFKLENRNSQPVIARKLALVMLDLITK